MILGFRVQSLELRVSGSGLEVEDLDVKGLRFVELRVRVYGVRLSGFLGWLRYEYSDSRWKKALATAATATAGLGWVGGVRSSGFGGGGFSGVGGGGGIGGGGGGGGGGLVGGGGGGGGGGWWWWWYVVVSSGPNKSQQV